MEKEKLKIGFIGGGRITNIFLEAWQKNKVSFEKIFVFDAQVEKSSNLVSKFAGVNTSSSITDLVNQCDVIFLAIHPPVFDDILNEIKESITEDKFLISLAPKITISKINQYLGKKVPVARVIPNAPSIIGKGFNVYSLSLGVNKELSSLLHHLFAPLGKFKNVNENTLESYATITGMGPTYFWFLFHEVFQQALKTGLSEAEAKEAVNEMLKGVTETIFNSNLNYEQVLDLIPSYPMKKYEESIQKIYADTISKLFDKLKN